MDLISPLDSKIVPFIVATAIGLMIGIERERRHFQPHLMGSRTFALLGLLGALTAWVDDEWVRAVMALFAVLLVVRESFVSKQPGMTTETAAAATFILGYLAHQNLLMVVVLGLIVLVLLLSRTPLHRFSREQLKPNEIQAAVIILVLSMGILPLLPAHAIDSWNILAPKRFVTILIFVASIQFVSYVLVRVLGERVGLPVSGFLAGFISSTALFLTLPDSIKKDKDLTNGAIAAAIFATVSTFVFLIVMLLVLSTELLMAVIWPLGISTVIGSVAGWLVARQSISSSHVPLVKSPLSLKAAVRLAFLFTLVLTLMHVVQHSLGNVGMQITSFLGGLTVLQGTSISAATMFVDSKVALASARDAILLTAFSSLISKLVIVWFLSRDRYAVVVSCAVLAMLIPVVVLGWLI